MFIVPSLSNMNMSNDVSCMRNVLHDTTGALTDGEQTQIHVSHSLGITLQNTKTCPCSIRFCWL